MKAKRKQRSRATERAWARQLHEMVIDLDPKLEGKQALKAAARIASLEHRVSELEEQSEGDAELAKRRGHELRQAEQEVSRLRAALSSAQRDWESRRPKLLNAIANARADASITVEYLIGRIERAIGVARDDSEPTAQLPGEPT